MASEIRLSSSDMASETSDPLTGDYLEIIGQRHTRAGNSHNQDKDHHGQAGHPRRRGQRRAYSCGRLRKPPGGGDAAALRVPADGGADLNGAARGTAGRVGLPGIGTIIVRAAGGTISRAPLYPPPSLEH